MGDKVRSGGRILVDQLRIRGVETAFGVPGESYSAGVHIAQQDSVPMVLLVGQIARGSRGRDAWQEVDCR